MLLKSFVAAGGASAALCGCALAQSGSGEATQTLIARPVVVEMFLSQSCKSSPPAAAVLAELAGRSDVIALGWHVDYWDQFQAQDVGAWSDPYARPAFVERQKAYNARMRGRPMMFTPQAVIDGFISVVGSKREAIERRIVEAQFYDEKANPRPPALTVERAADGEMLRARIDGVGAPYDAVVVRFRKKTVTEIPAGDNAGVTFSEANVVRAVHSLADDHAGPGDFTFESPPKGVGCAVLVQEQGQGRIVAARYCAEPTTTASNE